MKEYYHGIIVSLIFNGKIKIPINLVCRWLCEWVVVHWAVGVADWVGGCWHIVSSGCSWLGRGWCICYFLSSLQSRPWKRKTFSDHPDFVTPVSGWSPKVCERSGESRISRMEIGEPTSAFTVLFTKPLDPCSAIHKAAGSLVTVCSQKYWWEWPSEAIPHWLLHGWNGGIVLSQCLSGSGCSKDQEKLRLNHSWLKFRTIYWSHFRLHTVCTGNQFKRVDDLQKTQKH